MSKANRSCCSTPGMPAARRRLPQPEARPSRPAVGRSLPPRDLRTARTSARTRPSSRRSHHGDRRRARLGRLRGRLQRRRCHADGQYRAAAGHRDRRHQLRGSRRQGIGALRHRPPGPRIAVIRKTAEQKGVPLFINARTDAFFVQGDGSAAATREAIERGKAYAAAGASGLFIPGLTTDTLIAQVCENSTLPVNAMMMDGLPSHDRLAELGIARISYGNRSYTQAMKTLAQEAKNARV